MTQIFQCGDNTALVGYMYGECESVERAAIKAHIALCPACAAELASLESTRIQLASWTPPETELGFQVIRPQALGPKPQKASGLTRAGGWALRPGAWLHQPMPAWAQAAAAGVIFAAGLALGVARGSMSPADPAGTPPPAATGASLPAAVGTASARELTALEQRLRAEIAQIRTAASTTTGVARPQTASETELLARVRALIEESEQRQQRELALRTTQVMRDFDAQRGVDLAQIQRNFGQIEGLTGAEVRDQREVLNYLMRVSQQR